MRHYARALRVAFGFLTVLPVPLVKDWREDDLRLAVRAYPLVGLVIGCLLLLLALATVNLTSLLRAVLITASWLILTGALHFDGFCDMADAVFAPKSKVERWQILKDPRVGSFAFAAGVFLLLFKVAALAEILQAQQVLAALLIAPTLARSSVVYAMARYAVADSSLLGRRTNLHWRETYLPIGLGLLISVLVAAIWLEPAGLFVLWLAAALTSAGLAHWFNQALGGLGGDAYGAIIEANEAVLLLLMVMIKH